MKNKKIICLGLIILLMLSIMPLNVLAQGDNKTDTPKEKTAFSKFFGPIVDNFTNSFVNNVLNPNTVIDTGVGGFLGKSATWLATTLVGVNPVWHGVIGSTISGIIAYNQTDDKIEFTIQKDKVNISSEEKDYIDRTTDVKEDTQDKLYDNRMGANQGNNTYNYSHIALTDKNIIDYVFLNTVKISNYYDTACATSPCFKFEDETHVLKLKTIDGNIVTGQKRAIGFEDPNATIGKLGDKDENRPEAAGTEFRTLILEYPMATYKQPIKTKITGSNLLRQMGGNVVLPFVMPKKYLTEDVIFEGKSGAAKDIADARDVKTVKQAFHLQFNSFVPEVKELELESIDCRREDGMSLGTTGEEHLPKVAFDWSFSSAPNGGTAEAINGLKLHRDEWCDVNATDYADTTEIYNLKDGIYCDATQFTIEILNKINEINDYVTTNSDNCFVCPLPGSSQELLSDTNNFGVTFLSSSYDEYSGDHGTITVNYTIDGYTDINLQNIGDNNIIMSLDINIDSPINLINPHGGYGHGIVYFTKSQIMPLINGTLSELSGTTTIELLADLTSDDNVSVVARLDYNQAFTEMQALYNYEIAHQPLIKDNKLSNTFYATGGLQGACQIPHSSLNIKDYAAECSDQFDDSLVRFKSFLIKDGYSTDFKKNFDSYYYEQFMGAPGWYTGIGLSDPTELRRYFTDDGVFDHSKFLFTEKWETEPGALLLSGPGRYEVDINIMYDDQWRLFDAENNLTGTIVITLNKEVPPESDNPLYYMPFDGVLGMDNENSRIGYGLDYVGDVIMLDHDLSMKSDSYTSSLGVQTAEIKEIGPRDGDIQYLTTGDTRGKLLDITRTKSGLINLTFSPSRATPVIMKINNTGANKSAYAFYRLNVGAPEDSPEGGYAATPSPNLTYWTGFGAWIDNNQATNCLDFSGNTIQDAIRYKPDVPALASEYASGLGSEQAAVSYGIYWNPNEVSRTGNVFLSTIFYTPWYYITSSNLANPTGESWLYLSKAQDGATFYAPTSDSSSLPFEYDTEVPLNPVYTQIYDLKEIYQLVKEKKACVNYDSGSLEVYYNPKRIMDQLLGDTNADSIASFVTDRNGCINH